ncbi:flavin reductase family protein [Hyphomicrobium sp. D-2]|uniref:flavin reductase family protein n=1 Tax=Hyphomicrobium sp. D-2 TaxID=3041621 RepID=UPI0024557C7E|nr:flavin reductase family protein [Hyphomicrobium sp. D-2]MDH4981212.1 flavin reductase family protein [Hyphomicrobium sp. D-2]
MSWTSSVSSKVMKMFSSNSSVDSDAFRSVMRQLAGCVTVITTEGDGKLHGFTATAVCSVCAEPPSVLIAVNQTARTHPHIDKKDAFAINILSEDQKPLADHFATKGDDQFDTVEYALGRTGVPLLDGAAAHLECEVYQKIPIGTHTLFVGRVINTGQERRAPLVYYNARYGLIEQI